MIKMERGERVPLLMADDGVPLFRPTEWMVTDRRSANPAANTLQANCYALKFLYLWSECCDVDIEDRMLSGDYLRPHEINSLAAAAQNRLETFDKAQRKHVTPRNVVSLEQVRMREPETAKTVRKDTAANRLRTVSDYLSWLGRKGNLRLDLQAAALRKQALDEMTANLVVEIPKTRGRNVVGQRMAPPEEVMDRLLAAIEPLSPDNPWGDLGLRIRNRLLIHIFYALGVRRGEALGLKIRDHINLRAKKILIARNADDPEDTRTNQPLAKTRDRWIPLADGLVDMIQEYLTHIRVKVPNARKHQFLFVSHQDGAPLSLRGGNKVFEKLRERLADLPANLTPHVLRHAWNDAFSRLMDAKNVSPEREAQMRNEMQGWSPTSGTAATYNRRKITTDAEKFSLEHQKTLLGGDGK
jgi:site-specific recombinase XerD